jgi:hypothetical protein
MSSGLKDTLRIVRGTLFLAFVTVAIPLVFLGHVSWVLAGGWLA